MSQLLFPLSSVIYAHNLLASYIYKNVPTPLPLSFHLTRAMPMVTFLSGGGGWGGGIHRQNEGSLSQGRGDFFAENAPFILPGNKEGGREQKVDVYNVFSPVGQKSNPTPHGVRWGGLILRGSIKDLGHSNVRQFCLGLYKTRNGAGYINLSLHNDPSMTSGWVGGGGEGVS
jgi:hypothetical protein